MNASENCIDFETENCGSYEAVIVQCPSFRCAGFKDALGIWRDYYRHSKLPLPLVVLEPLYKRAPHEARQGQ